MATHSRILAWRIPWTEEPGGLQYMSKHPCTCIRHKNFTAVTIFKDAVQWPWWSIFTMTVCQW